jgi:hypothetical protein
MVACCRKFLKQSPETYILWQMTNETIDEQLQNLQTCKIIDFRRNGARKIVVEKEKMGQISQVS